MKYMGSKSRIARDILPIILEHRTASSTYFEPFVGGCGSMDKVRGPKRVGNDINPYLIEMWKALQDGTEFPTTISKEMYDRWRKYYHITKTRIDGAIKEHIALCGWIGFMGSINGRFYDGGYSGHSVIGKNGIVRDYISENIRNTMRQIPLLKKEEVEFMSVSDDDFFALPKEGDIVYCDPPYQGTKQYAYSKGFDYEKFWSRCRDLSDRGVYVYVSEHNAPDDFECVWQKKVVNALHPSKTYRPIEKLFVPKS